VNRAGSRSGIGRVAVVGGGIAGLAAAYFLRDADVTVLEGSPLLGGKLTVSEVAGVAVDSGAEALLARRPEGVELIRAVGLGDELKYPGTTAASLWTRGQFRALPRRQFLGVPADLDDLEQSAILSAEGLNRARRDEVLPATPRDGDVAVAAQVGARFGGEVVDRLVEPLLGGVYAGRPDQLSFEATLPGLAEVSRLHRSLADAAAAALGPLAEPGGRPVQPVFTTLAGGLGSLPGAVAAASGAAVRTRATVRALARAAGGWRLTLGPATTPEALEADAVVLALPARPASRLLGEVPGASSAAVALGEIEYASMAIVTLAYPAAAFGESLRGSGYLVPAVDGRAVKAVTFSTVKWPHLRGADQPHAADADRPRAGELAVVRCSVGRIGEEAVLHRDDADLAAVAAGDLALATGVTGDPVDVRVTRWGGGLPQYTVGHLDRVRRIREGVALLPGLAVCGAAFDGIGIPACIASARLAADQIRSYLQTSRAAARQ
jgi:protoporphyrinogen/coproporphyrinogen III oxidase